MNKRQAKKAYKKKYGHNPPVKSVLYQAYDIDMQNMAEGMRKALKKIGEVITEIITEAGRALATGWETVKQQIHNMSEEEYEEFLAELTPQARCWAAVIRKGVEKHDTGN